MVADERYILMVCSSSIASIPATLGNLLLSLQISARDLAFADGAGGAGPVLFAV